MSTMVPPADMRALGLSPILDYLYKRLLSGQGGGAGGTGGAGGAGGPGGGARGAALRPAGPGGNPYAARSITPVQSPRSPGSTPSPAAMPAPSREPMTKENMLEEFTGPLDTGPDYGPERPTPLNFAWGGREPQPYTPGETDIMSFAGAPAGRSGFMGQLPDDPSRGGGYIDSSSWEDVPNPAAFPSFSEQMVGRGALRADSLEADEARRTLEDPYHRVRGEKMAEAEAGAFMQKEILGFLQEQKEQLAQRIAEDKLQELQSDPRFLSLPPIERQRLEQDALTQARFEAAQMIGGGSGLR